MIVFTIDWKRPALDAFQIVDDVLRQGVRVWSHTTPGD